MFVIFCQDVLEPKRVDDAYADESQAVAGLGGHYELVDFEALVNEHSPARAVWRVGERSEPATALYRGWMLSPQRYAELFEALLNRGVRLINDPQAYRQCHWLPECYPIIERHTPQSVWLGADAGLDIDRVMAALTPLQPRPVIVKDFVKSQKHYWYEACFIPDSSDRAAVDRVVRAFLDLQGEDLAGGLVFREYVELRRLTEHSRSGMPLSEEYRVFVLDGRPVFMCNYWEEGQYDSHPPVLSQFEDVMRMVPSRFYTMDLARTADGRWIIVELGDGQVSGLQTGKPVALYSALASSLD
jgi:hypothetical protein